MTRPATFHIWIFLKKKWFQEVVNLKILLSYTSTVVDHCIHTYVHSYIHCDNSINTDAIYIHIANTLVWNLVFSLPLAVPLLSKISIVASKGAGIVSTSVGHNGPRCSYSSNVPLMKLTGTKQKYIIYLATELHTWLC